MSNFEEGNNVEGKKTKKTRWALILGGSKGLGFATVQKLARHGYSILVVHRDRKTDLPELYKHFENLRAKGVTLHNFNADAINSQSRNELVNQIEKIIPGRQKISVLVHSIAKGHLKPMLTKKGEALEGTDLQLTINAMAISLYDWTKVLYEHNLFSPDTRIIAFTSEGNTKALPYYAAVSAAKCALEAIVRSIAMEFASLGVKANCIQAGVTDTESFRRIPNSEKIKKAAIRRNPNGRLTKAEDVANAVYLLCQEEASWITGTVIKVDGGESLL